MASKKDTPLGVKIEDGQLVIRIGIDTLAFAYTEVFHQDKDELEQKIQVIFPDKLEFAKDVMWEMTREDEIGNSPLTKFLDDMMAEAVNQGSAGIDFPEIA